jgi:hypothetical protein
MKEYAIAVILMSSPPVVSNTNEQLVLDGKNQESVVSKYMKPISSYQKINPGKRSQSAAFSNFTYTTLPTSWVKVKR